MRDEGRTLRATKPFSLMPRAQIGGPDEWTSLRRGRWKIKDHVTLGEARGVLAILDLWSSRKSLHRARIISLQDNQGVSGSFTKGRSPAPALNFLCRRRAGRSLAAQLWMLLPWVQSDLMPADRDSRLKC
jgi:hypothetical protein